jgi:ABC-2 type transport system ATP-binding protein
VPAIVVDDVSKTFTLRRARTLKETAVRAMRGEDLTNTVEALKHVTFKVDGGESVGLVGLNGSGKSTLLKLISGVMRPDRGTVRVGGRVAGLIAVGAGLHGELTGRDNIFLNAAILGMTEQETKRKFDQIVAFSGLERFLDTEVKFYSSGMYMRLGFSVAVHTEPDVFLADEVLSVGDGPFKRKCRARLGEHREQGRTLVMVAHGMKSLEQMCDRGIMLEKGEMTYDGTMAEAARRYDPNATDEDKGD